MKKGVIVIVVVGIAAALGVVVQRQFGGDTAPVAESAASTELSPDAAADALAREKVEPEVKPDPVIPETLPDFALADATTGKMRKLAEWKGQPLMVNFWATWCVPCRREIPLLNELHAEHRAMKLEIVGIAVDFRDDVIEYVKGNPLAYPLLIGEEDGLAAVTAMGVQAAFPFTVFADSQQRILALKLGELHRDEAEMILDRLARVDAGTLPLADARTQITAELKVLATKRAAAKAATG